MSANLSGSPGSTCPPPINIDTLRTYFKEQYELQDFQIEPLVQSSAKSINQSLLRAEQALKSEARQEQLVHVFHGLKGVFLNMGENQWAAFIKQLEQDNIGSSCDLENVMAEIQVVLARILSYETDTSGDTKA